MLRRTPNQEATPKTDSKPEADHITDDYNKDTNPGADAQGNDYAKDSKPEADPITDDYNKDTNPGADPKGGAQGSDYAKDSKPAADPITDDYNKDTNPGADPQTDDYAKGTKPGAESINPKPSQGEGKDVLDSFAETGKDRPSTKPGTFDFELNASGSEKKPDILEAIPDYDGKPSNLRPVSPDADKPVSLRPDYSKPESLNSDYEKKPPSLRPDYNNPEYGKRPPSLRPNYSRNDGLVHTQGDRSGQDPHNRPGMGGFGISLSIPVIGQIPFGLNMGAQPVSYGQVRGDDIYQRRLRKIENDYRKRAARREKRAQRHY
ncbi:hypothetical protein DSO57_1013306 [Entomophthora muscae]|uniref:Uncharacterized protein n=1 Tax=Entomophthora muscae TaxID=34485 RepID=A0ACC2TGA9_9FUNG|nr:hypothetical protein DSO57_1013306 [Entomophthora muscae]